MLGSFNPFKILKSELVDVDAGLDIIDKTKKDRLTNSGITQKICRKRYSKIN